jgi:SAM-dependent methyltransferase
VEALEAHLLRQIEHSSDFFWHRVRHRFVAAHAPGGPFELVDVGAGVGLLGEWLRGARPDATYRFVEPLERLERHLEQRFGAAANARGEERYEHARLVTLLDVLEHQADDAAFLAELVGRLAPGATLVVTVPALQSLWSSWDETLGHHRRYDKVALARTVGDLPVEVEELSYLFPEMVPLAAVRRRRPAGEGAEFPDLPRRVNDVLTAVGRVSLAGRRLWPGGTSLAAVLRRR